MALADYRILWHLYAALESGKSDYYCFLSLICAFLTYKLAETPLKRFVMAANYKVIILGFLLPAVSFIAIAQTIKTHEGFPERFPKSVQDKQEALHTYAHVIRSNCMDTADQMFCPVLKIVS